MSSAFAVLMLVDESWLWDRVIGRQLPARPCVVKLCLYNAQQSSVTLLFQPSRRLQENCEECAVWLFDSSLSALTRTRRTALH